MTPTMSMNDYLVLARAAGMEEDAARVWSAKQVRHGDSDAAILERNRRLFGSDCGDADCSLNVGS